MSTFKNNSALEFLSDEVFYDKGYTRILVRHYKDKVGREREWGMMHLNTFGAGAVIVALTPNREIILERVFRVTFNDWVLELPGGCDDVENESGEMVAMRELQEETGYVVSSAEFLTEIADAPGVTDQRTEIYLGLEARKIHEPVLEDSEIIETMIVPVDELCSFLELSTDICDSKVWIAVAFLYRRGFLH